MTYTYARARWVAGVIVQDAVLLLALAMVVATRAPGPLTAALAVAIPLVLAWGFVTLHFPSRITIDAHGATFAAYGRSHAFPWADVTRVRVRRFLVGDRVLVRLSPAPRWRGRYWVTRSIEGFDDLVRMLDARAEACAARGRVASENGQT